MDGWMELRVMMLEKLSVFSWVLKAQPQRRVAHHDGDVQDAKLLLGRIIGWVFSWVGKVQATILVVDVEEQCAIFQPLLLPAHQRDVFRITRNLYKRKTKDEPSKLHNHATLP